MSLTLAQLRELPSPFYRVSAKALIFNGAKLLVVKNKAGGWEIPGGCWEHDETIEECLTRELQEEVDAEIATIGDVQLVWRDYSSTYEVHYLRLGVPVTITSSTLTARGVDDVTELEEVRFVSKAEFLVLDFESAEEGVKQYADKIWSNN